MPSTPKIVSEAKAAVPSEPAASPASARRPILSRREVARDTLEVRFGSVGVPFPFKAGQYVRVTVPNLLHPDERGASREFSIASAPSDAKSFAVAFRKSGSGFKRTLEELPVGSEVIIDGPLGLDYLDLPGDPSVPVAMVAGGIGITPFMSLLSDAADRALPHRFVLLYANSDAASVPYAAELEAIAARMPGLRVERVSGPLDDAAFSRMGNLPGALWFVAGPTGMVEAALAALHRLGVPDTSVRLEDMSGYGTFMRARRDGTSPPPPPYDAGSGEGRARRRVRGRGPQRAGGRHRPRRHHHPCQ